MFDVLSFFPPSREVSGPKTSFHTHSSNWALFGDYKVWLVLSYWPHWYNNLQKDALTRCETDTIHINKTNTWNFINWNSLSLSIILVAFIWWDTRILNLSQVLQWPVSTYSLSRMKPWFFWGHLLYVLTFPLDWERRVLPLTVYNFVSWKH